LILEGQGQARLHLKSNDPWSHEWGPVHLIVIFLHTRGIALASLAPDAEGRSA
jgi:hypothetical protein